jgi:hypothetical protein
MLKKIFLLSTLIVISYFTISAQTPPLKKSTDQVALKADTARIYLSVGKDGLVTNLSFLPEKQKPTASEMSIEGKKSDSVARKMLRLINEKKTDSSYLLLGENFRKQRSSDAWKNFMEKSFYLHLPFNEFTFLGKANNISKYKSGLAQFLISLCNLIRRTFPIKNSIMIIH